MLPLIISLILLILDPNEDLIESILIQRQYPQSTFALLTQIYMKWLGIIEIVIKLVTFFIFIGTFVMIKMHENELLKKNVVLSDQEMTICDK